MNLVSYNGDNDKQDDDNNHVYDNNGNENYKEDDDYDNDGYQTSYDVGCQ